MLRCNICGGETVAIEVMEQMLGLKEKFTYYQCKNCGHTHLGESPGNLEKYYNKETYYSFSKSPFENSSPLNKIKAGFRKLFLSLNSKNNFLFTAALQAFLSIKDIPRSAMILDYGSGGGKFVKELHGLGFRNTKGYDPFLEKDIYHNNELYVTNNMDSFKDIKWDVIIMNHVFEHVPDPAELLTALKKRLAVKGKLLIRIPVIDSYAFEKYKENWVQFDAPRHINLFTRKSIKILIEKIKDYSIIDMHDDSYHFQFTGSELYLKNLSLSRTHNSRLKRLTSLRTYKYHFLAKKLNRQNKGDQIVLVLEYCNPY